MIRRGGGGAIWLAALAFLGLLQTAWFISSVPLALKAGAAALLALSVARPAWGLFVWAGLAPLTTSLAGLAGATVLGAQLLEIMSAAVLTGVVWRHTAGTPTRLALPALWMGAVAVASGLSELPARLMTSTQEHVGYAAIAHLLFEHAVDRISPLDPWYFALLVVEGAALAWAAESLARRQPEVAARVVWCALAGHAGVAVLNITRLVGASLRTGDFPSSLPDLFLNIREHTQYDVNAAASIFVLVILSAFGLSTRRARLPLALFIGAVVIALWVAGSRVAMAALLATLAAVLALRARGSAKRLWIAGATLAAAAGVVAWLAIGYPVGRNLSLPTSIASRMVLFKAALGMAADAPVLGIGAGTFLEESPHYGATALAGLVYDGRTRDNSHNYFLQTLAEQGILGLLALLAMLWAALQPAMRAAPQRDALLKWLAAGVIGSILTWMSGHPLLVTEAALVFWLFVGALAGLSSPHQPSPALKRIVIIAVLAVMASVPFRAREGERAADLEHIAMGVSPWQPAIDGERYRQAGAEFSIFLPSGTMMVLPMRSATESPVTAELRIDSRLIDAVEAPPDTWRAVRIQMPDSESRYLKVDFRVIGSGPPCQTCLWVGKAVPVTQR